MSAWTNEDDAAHAASQKEDMEAARIVAAAMGADEHAANIGELLERFDDENDEHQGLLWQTAMTLVGSSYTDWVFSLINDV